MINPEKIDEWIREVEERPGSAAVIIRYIANRLRELVERNEELLSENIELRTGRKVEEFESRIANLQYQADLLKRQLRGEAVSLPAEFSGEVSQQAKEDLAKTAPIETTSLLVYNIFGQVLRVELDLKKLESRQRVGSFSGEIVLKHPETGLLSPIPRLLATSSQEELLFVFDSGRTVTHPATVIPSGEAEALGWQGAYSEEPRGEEELATILPVARMSMYEFSVQVSRRGCVKKIKEASFESHIARGYIGTGIQSAPDKTCSLALCGLDDLLVLVSKEGFLVTLEIGDLPYTIEEVLHLGITDHIVTAFIIGKKPSILVVTHNGKALQREAGRLESAVTFKTRRQAIIPKERREAGVRVVGAGAVTEGDWGFALRSDGKLAAYTVGDLFNRGSLFSEEQVEILGFTTV